MGWLVKAVDLLIAGLTLAERAKRLVTRPARDPKARKQRLRDAAKEADHDDDARENH